MNQIRPNKSRTTDSAIATSRSDINAARKPTNDGWEMSASEALKVQYVVKYG